MIGAKISKIPAFAYPAALLAVAGVIITIAVPANIYGYTFNDVFNKLNIAIILTAIIGVAALIKSVLNILSLKNRLVFSDGTLNFTCLHKFRFVRLSIQQSDIASIYCAQSLFEKITKCGTVFVKTSGKTYRVRNVLNAENFIRQMQKLTENTNV